MAKDEVQGIRDRAAAYAEHIAARVRELGHAAAAEGPHIHQIDKVRVWRLVEVAPARGWWRPGHREYGRVAAVVRGARRPTRFPEGAGGLNVDAIARKAIAEAQRVGEERKRKKERLEAGERARRACADIAAGFDASPHATTSDNGVDGGPEVFSVTVGGLTAGQAREMLEFAHTMGWVKKV